MITLLVMTDGRDCIIPTLDAADAMLAGPVTRRVIHDDTGDREHRSWLADRYPRYEIVYHPDGRQGYGGAIRSAWSHLRDRAEQYIFHLEDDFVLQRQVPLVAMADVLDARRYLTQLALRRQPWNPQEQAAGGIVEQYPDDYTEVTDGPNIWLEHRKFFTTNPSLYRSSLCRRQWPHGAHSEGEFSVRLFAGGARSGYWGARGSGEWCVHVGHERAGTGY